MLRQEKPPQLHDTMQLQPSAPPSIYPAMPTPYRLSQEQPSVLAAQPQSQPIILVNANAATLPLGHRVQRLSCPHCQITMVTRLEHRVTKRTHAFAFALCITGLLCLVPLPYCLNTCKSLDHYCSNCNQFIGKSVT